MTEFDLHLPLNEDEYLFGLKAVNALIYKALIYKVDCNYDSIIVEKISLMNVDKVNVMII